MGTDNELERAREYVLAGHYGLAIDLLVDCEDWKAPLNERALLLRAEIALRRDPVSALEMLARVNDLFVTAEGRFGYFIASGKAYALSRNPGAASDMFASAAAIVADGYPQGVHVLAYQRARLAWLQQQFDPASADIALALASDDPALRFETLAVRAWMHAGLGHFGAQLSDLVAATAVANENLYVCDVRSVGRTLHSLFRAALELGDASATEAGERVYARIIWTDDTREEHFLILRALAWNAFLGGQSARAQWLFRDSKEVAPSDAWKVMAHVDRSFVARLNGNDAWATDELFEAHALARTVVWSETRSEEREALSMLAALFAPVDMAQAQHYVSTYIRMGVENLDASLGITQDRRAEAYSLYAMGRVQQMLGNTASARKALEQAYEIFVTVEYHFRAALAAEALGDLTQEPEWMARARTHAGHFPKSALFSYLASPSAKAEGSPVGLAPFHRKLAAALCEGLDAPQLSRRFSRSEFTIRREMQALFDALDVTSLAQLRALFEDQRAV